MNIQCASMETALLLASGSTELLSCHLLNPSSPPRLQAPIPALVLLSILSFVQAGRISDMSTNPHGLGRDILRLNQLRQDKKPQSDKLVKCRDTSSCILLPAELDTSTGLEEEQPLKHTQIDDLEITTPAVAQHSSRTVRIHLQLF